MTGALGTAGCGDPVDPPDSMKNPFGFWLGPPDSSDDEIVAGLWAAAALTAYIAMVVLIVVTGVVGTVLCYVVKDATLKDAIDTTAAGHEKLLLRARWPGCAVGAVAAMLGMAIEASMTGLAVALSHKVAIAMLTIAVIVSTVLLSFIAFVTVRRGGTSRPSAFPSQLAPVANDKMAFMFVFRLRQYAKGEFEWESASATDMSVAKAHYRHEIIYEDYVASRRWFMGVDIGLGLLSAAVGAVRSVDPAVCLTAKAVGLALGIIFIVTVALLRPFLKPLDTTQAAVTGLAAAVISVLVLCDAVDTAQKVAATGVLLFAVRIALMTFLWIYEQLSRRETLPRGVHRSFLVDGLLDDDQDTNDAHLDDHETLLFAPAAGADELPQNPLERLEAEEEARILAARRAALLQVDDDADGEGATDSDAEARKNRRRAVLDDEADVNEDGPAVATDYSLFNAGRRLVLADTGMANPITQAYGGGGDACDAHHEDECLVGVAMHQRSEMWDAATERWALGTAADAPTARRLTDEERQAMI